MGKILLAAAVVAVLFMPSAAGCGGRTEKADCHGETYCAEADVCCPSDYTCGTGRNGCPLGGCCTASYIEEHGGDAGQQ